MKLSRIIVAPLVVVLTMLNACASEVEAFCETSVARLCQHCYACGGDDDQGSHSCGLSVETDEEGCRIILERVCVSQAPRRYGPETAQRCQEQLDTLSCDGPVQAPQAREACHSLF